MTHTSASRSRRLLCLLVVASSSFSSAFVRVDKQQPRKCVSPPHDVGLKLVPLSTFSDKMSMFSESDEQRGCLDSNGCFHDRDDIYELALVEAEDLTDLCRFIVGAFGAEAIRFSQDLNSFEQLLLSPAAELLNSYSALVAFAEVFSGTKQRLSTRLEKLDISPPRLTGLTMQEMIDVADRDSLIIALVKKDAEPLEVIGSIELRLQV